MVEVAVGETRDQITGNWDIFQLAKGHRFSTDDVVAAWTAANVRPNAKRLIDIGAGIGSVGLMTLYLMKPDAKSVFVEVQEVSHRLCRKTIEHNNLGDRVELRHGDLRDEAMIPESGMYDLVTGSPPYFPLGTGVVSPNPQRAGARMELKGNVFDYCRTAARLMKPDAAFVLVHSAVDPRPEEAIAAAGLTLNSRQDVLFRAGRAPTIAVFTSSFGGDRVDPDPLVMRTADGDWGLDRLMLRKVFGI
ncbi:MAG: SAM-dependent methyltransferase [Deltaproteobacteria bacterium]|nr:SAM-dependent methyltransferase [Deltaproteobacteria bacterium]|tara:strand:- start:264 stop:1004 length:741 start_codon:yes stop_codon:yes gene_type:complete